MRQNVLVDAFFLFGQFNVLLLEQLDDVFQGSVFVVHPFHHGRDEPSDGREFSFSFDKSRLFGGLIGDFSKQGL